MTTPSPIQLPAPAPLLTRSGWSAFIVVLLVGCAVAPGLNLWVPAGSAFHLSDYAVAVPGVISFVFGYFAFRSRIKGVYFSIITQAMTYAAMLLFFRNETGFGGNKGFTDFKRILGMQLATQNMRMTLFVL